MKKRKNLGKKLVTMLVSVGFFAVLITVLNLMALQAIRGKNNVLIEQFEQYEEAVENNDTAVFETAKGEVAEAIRHINYRINGSIIFDLALVVADIIVIVLLSIVINKSIVRPAKRAKNDLDDIIIFHCFFILFKLFYKHIILFSNSLNAIKLKTVIKTAKKPTDTNIVTNFFPKFFLFFMFNFIS